MTSPNKKGTVYSPTPKLIKLPEVMEICGIGKTTIYELMKVGKFPQTVPMGVVRCAFWLNTEIYVWVSSPSTYRCEVKS